MPRQTKHTKDKFLDAGAALVQEKGFDSTSVADIAALAGAPKGSFFNHFASKDDFGAALIRHFGGGERQHVMAFLAASKGTPLETIRAMVQRRRDSFMESRNCGCLVGSMAQTVAGRSEACRVAANEHFAAAREVLGGLIAAAQEAGELDPDVDPARLASLLQSAMQGAMISAKSRQDPAPFDDILEIILKPIQ